MPSLLEQCDYVCKSFSLSFSGDVEWGGAVSVDGALVDALEPQQRGHLNKGTYNKQNESYTHKKKPNQNGGQFTKHGARCILSRSRSQLFRTSTRGRIFPPLRNTACVGRVMGVC